MNAFRTHLSRTGASEWNDLTHADVCQLCALWIETSPHDFEDAIWQSDPRAAMAAVAIEMFSAQKRCEGKLVTVAKLAIADMIKDAVIEQVKISAESWLRMRKAWLAEMGQGSADKHDYTKDSELLGARVMDRSDANAA